MYTRIIEIDGALDPIAVRIKDERDHELIDEKLEELDWVGGVVISDETLDMPGATPGKNICRFIETIQDIIDRGDSDGDD